MPRTKRKAVFSAEADSLARVENLVRRGRYRNLSEFVREAMAEKLQCLRRERLSEQVARYCAAGHAAEDDDLISAQAFHQGLRRAKR